jgi:hypothetical protein
MFCDLVGSTALSTSHDPEDLHELIGDYHCAVNKTVGRFDGFVAKYMGDGVLIYFGYPQAHEDDAERAVRAGLAVIEAVGHSNTADHATATPGKWRSRPRQYSSIRRFSSGSASLFRWKASYSPDAVMPTLFSKSDSMCVTPSCDLSGGSNRMGIVRSGFCGGERRPHDMNFFCASVR